MPRPPTLAVASYNVHRCVGSDLRQDAARVASVIRELRARVIGLQEVESHHTADDERNQARYLEEATGLRAISGGTMKRGEAEFGNVLLTSERIVAVKRHDLAIAGREPRGALDVELETGDGPLRVVLTHLGLSQRERDLQGGMLADILEDGGTAPCLLMGDINEWRPWGAVLRIFGRRFGRTPSPATFPSILPVLPLDRIWIGPRASLIDLAVHRTRAAVAASDHLPVRAVLRLGAPATRPPSRGRRAGPGRLPAPSG